MDKNERELKHRENREKINRTLQIINHGMYISCNGKAVTLKNEPEVIFIDLHEYEGDSDFDEMDPVVTVDDIDTFGCAITKFKGRHPLVLNFANPIHPGGGVYQGSNAQEEDLCRRSTLLPALESDEAAEYYSINSYYRERGLNCYPTALLIKNVEVFVDSEGQLMDVPEMVDILTIAAPYVKNDAIYEFSNYNIKNIVASIISIAAGEGYECAVLGAIGCGAFNQDPYEVAEAFNNNIESGCYYGRLSEISFAIPTRGGISTENYDAFCRYFG